MIWIRKAIVLGLLGCSMLGCQDQRPPIVRAVSLGRTQEVASLMGPGFDVNQPYPPHGRTLLQLASKAGQAEVVELLLSKGARLDPKDSQGWTAFDLALNRDEKRTWSDAGQIASLVRLLRAGYPVSTQPDSQGHNFLHLMAMQNDSSALIQQILATNQFPVDGRDPNGWTALHLAAHHGRYENCLALLAAGADVNAESTVLVGRTRGGGKRKGPPVWEYRYEAGSRPLDVERSSGSRQKSLARLLEEHGGKRNPSLHNLRRF